MWARSDQYSSGATGSKNNQAALAADIKSHLKNVAPQPVLSKGWLAMSESLQHIATVASLEHIVSHGTANTLWESQQVAVRCLIDDSKLNTCLRTMKDLKEFRRKADAEPAVLQGFVASMGDEAVEARMNVFERALGALLEYAFFSIECLQLADMPLLLQHIAEVLDYALAHPQVMNQLSTDNLQEMLVFSYLASIADRLDKLQEDRIMGLIEEHKLISLAIRNLSVYYSLYSRQALFRALSFLSRTMDSEEFQTHKRRFISPEEEKAVAGFAVLKEFSPTERAKLHTLLKVCK